MTLARRFPTDAAKQYIERTGYYFVTDARAGPNDAEDVTENASDTGQYIGKGTDFAKFYYTDGYATKTPYGLEFVRKTIFQDPVIWDIITSIITQPHWGYTRVYGDVLPSDQAWFFHVHAEFQQDQPIHSLLVQFWIPGSRVIYYQGSQLRYIQTSDPDQWGLNGAPRSELKRDGIVEKVEDFPHGAYTIMDSRLGFTPIKGLGMHVAIGTKDEVMGTESDPGWGPMQLPDTEPLRAKHAELEASGFKSKVIFIPFDGETR